MLNFLQYFKWDFKLWIAQTLQSVYYTVHMTWSSDSKMHEYDRIGFVEMYF